MPTRRRRRPPHTGTAEALRPTARAASLGEGTPGSGTTDQSKPQRTDEQLLTGETADKVTAAAKAKEPDATIERVETDSDGVYEAHMVRADGTHITVQVGADFQVTNVIEGGTEHGKGGQKAPAGGAPGGEAPSASGSASSS